MNVKNIFIAIIVMFSIIGFECKAQDDNAIDYVVAVVGADVIKRSDIENQYLQMRAQGYFSAADMKCEIFEELLFQKLLLNQAKIDSIQVTEKDVEFELRRRLDFFVRQIGSEKEMEEYFNKTMYEIKSDFRGVIRDQLLTQKMQGQITGNVSVSPSEVAAFFGNMPKDSIPLINSQIEAAQIVLYPEVTKEDEQAVKDKLEGYRKRILGGDSFSAFARLYSQDRGSAAKGGELGLTNRNELVSEFSAAAFSLKPGELSEVIKTEFGYHIIQLIERQGELINVRHILMTAKVSPVMLQAAKNKLDSIATLVRIDTLTFEQAALKFSEDNSTKFNQGLIQSTYSGSTKFEEKELDPETKISIRALSIGQITPPFEAKDTKNKGVLKIVKLVRKSEPHKANLTDDYQMIKNKAELLKRTEAIEKWIENKQKSTYIHLDESFSNCNFNSSGWKK